MILTRNQTWWILINWHVFTLIHYLLRKGVQMERLGDSINSPLTCYLCMFVYTKMFRFYLLLSTSSLLGHVSIVETGHHGHHGCRRCVVEWTSISVRPARHHHCSRPHNSKYGWWWTSPSPQSPRSLSSCWGSAISVSRLKTYGYEGYSKYTANCHTVVKPDIYDLVIWLYTKFVL